MSLDSYQGTGGWVRGAEHKEEQESMAERQVVCTGLSTVMLRKLRLIKIIVCFTPTKHNEESDLFSFVSTCCRVMVFSWHQKKILYI